VKLISVRETSGSGVDHAPASGTVLKKRKCADQDRCSHKWTLRYWDDGRQRELNFADELDGSGRPRYGSDKADPALVLGGAFTTFGSLRAALQPLSGRPRLMVGADRVAAGCCPTAA
jgi:hypothetical protein